MPIKWDESHSVKVKELDEQHKIFIEILNKLYQYVYENKNREELHLILDELVAYAQKHFETEEKYFDLYYYDDSESHKKEHETLKLEVLNFQKEFLEGKKDITLELVDFLENWLVDHLDNQDQKYADFFNEKGLF